MIMSDDEELKFRIETAKLKDAKQQAEFDKAERPARENIDALLAEAAERRAKADQKRREIETHLEQTERTIDRIFIMCFILLVLVVLGIIAVSISHFFW